MQQRMMQFMHRGSGSNSHAAANAAAAAAAEAVVAAAEDTQNSPQGKPRNKIVHLATKYLMAKNVAFKNAVYPRLV